ncbi:MAG TPA: exodeoxyribonuclease VII large subunit [Desulfopila sp.]|nr:exodeoxyribonuclease VII large subunit [Desulfopila sp.]
MSILTVTELTKAIHSTLELHYRFVHIRGEISNLRTPYSGHIYFTLKDSGAQIRAVLFKGQQKYLRQKLEEGLSVICHGRVSVYEPRGEYQILIDTIDFSGRGDLRLEFEKLKARLAEEGLFAPEAKKPLPLFPEHILVITSPTGAAVHDFCKIATKRRYWGKISILPVAVQGKNASQEIARAIATANNETDADLIVLIRGGGSLEDLWAFNEEQTARAIHSSALPVVTGIGHDIDHTIADLCADVATHTPTAAAEAVIVDTDSLCQVFLAHRKQLVDLMYRKILVASEKVDSLRRVIGSLDLYLANHQLRIDYQTTALTNIIDSRISRLQAKIEAAFDRVSSHSPLQRINLQRQRLDYLEDTLARRMTSLLQRNEQILGRQAALLDSVSPLSVLSRGYAIISKKTVDPARIEVVRSSAQVEIGAELDVTLHKGGLRCEVVGKRDS